jgi:hypothetical protein
MVEARSPMRVVEVDERDSNWEDAAPRFRVYLHASSNTETTGSTATFDITGADILGTIDWAQRQAGDRLTYAIALVRDDLQHEALSPGHGRGLIWLVGADGNDRYDAHETGHSVQQRMLRRRNNPIIVSVGDRAPGDLAQLNVFGDHPRQ